MAEYIEREALLKSIMDDTTPLSLAMVYRHIHSTPTADVAPVVHGRWIENQPLLANCTLSARIVGRTRINTPR